MSAHVMPQQVSCLLICKYLHSSLSLVFDMFHQARWGQAINRAATLESLTAALDIPQSDLLQEVIELQDWVLTINVLDSALEAVLRHHPTLILLWDKGGPPKPRPVPPDFAVIASAISQVRIVTTKQA
jgi:hypothetical protein